MVLGKIITWAVPTQPRHFRINIRIKEELPLWPENDFSPHLTKEALCLQVQVSWSDGLLWTSHTSYPLWLTAESSPVPSGPVYFQSLYIYDLWEMFTVRAFFRNYWRVFFFFLFWFWASVRKKVTLVQMKATLLHNARVLLLCPGNL